VAIGYGMTETSPVSTKPARRAPRKTGQHGFIVHPHVEIKVSMPRSGRLFPRGTLGEFCTRGYSVMLGY
jgi:fatty-acyl-CoA synthase